jgi:mRNA interferase MazF
MTRFEAGDIVRVLFPHVERNVRRPRPALVVTKEPIGPNGLLFWAAMITNAERERWTGDIDISHHEAAGLPVPSMVRTAKLATLETAAASVIGKIDAGQLEQVRKQVAAHLGLTSI